MTNRKIKKALEEIRVGDSLQINDWEYRMATVGVSEHFIVAVNYSNGTYTVIWKEPLEYGCRDVKYGDYACAPDAWVFGSPLQAKYPDLYKFNNMVAIAEYLKDFEEGNAHLSMKNLESIKEISFSRG